VTIDPVASTARALELRPDVIRQRLAVRGREQELLAAKNLGLPQVDAVGLYRWNGVGDRLDDSLNQMITTQFADWQTSLTFSMPLGRRAAAGAIRAATLQLAREKAMLQQTTHSAVHSVNALAREAEYAYRLYTEANARLRANTDWLEGAKIRYENPPPDGDDWLLAATNDYLSALRSQADASSDTQSFLARYNASLARLSEATGTILDEQSVVMSGETGPMSRPGAPLGKTLSAPAPVPPFMPAVEGRQFLPPNFAPMPLPGPTPFPAAGAVPGLPGPNGAKATPAETFFGPSPRAPVSPSTSLSPVAPNPPSGSRPSPAETFFSPSTSSAPLSAPAFPPRGSATNYPSVAPAFPVQR